MDDNALRGADNLGEVEENPEDEKHAAALVVCHHATDASEAAELLAMLGLTSVRARRLAKPCAMCLRPMSNMFGVGHVRQQAKGMCGSCYGQAQRGGAPGKQLVVAVEDIDTPVGVLVAGARVYAKAHGGAWLLSVPGSRLPVAVSTNAVRLAEAAAS